MRSLAAPAKATASSGGARLVSSAPPKRPPTSYFLYIAEARASPTFASRGLKGKDQAKVLGEMWRALSEGERARYGAEATALKASYEADKTAWEAVHGPIPKGAQRKKGAPPPRKPKKATAYQVFFKDTKPTLAATMPFGEASKLISAKWKATAPDAKGPYEARAAEITRKQLADWEKTMAAA